MRPVSGACREDGATLVILAGDASVVAKGTDSKGMPNFDYEVALGGRVAGLDEAGRGPWAGPVVAACVVLDAARVNADLLDRINDSKKLSRRQREDVFEALGDAASEGAAHIGIGEASVTEIDTLNILQASLLAMQRAFEVLAPPPNGVLVDGNQAPTLACPMRCVVGGDGLSLSIAAASIAAKVTRDRAMVALSHRFPGYGWERNAGYGTKEHRAALDRLGVTPEHRRSFKPIRNILTRDGL